MTAGAPLLLLVEDDPLLGTFLADNLAADGYELAVAETLRDGLREVEYKRPELAIVDLALPDGSGFDLIARVREADGLARLDPLLPVIVLSGRAGELDRVRAFERGADDFVSKPFSYPELRHRVSAVLRRANGRRVEGRLRVGDLELDPASREVRLRGRGIHLSQKEFALLRALAAEPTRVLTKEELLRDVWGFRSLGTTRTLDSHACRLRQKLSADGDRFVVNVWGVGYRLVDGPVPEEAGRVIGPLLCFVAVAAVHAEGQRRLAWAARADHDVRGPLCTARLALGGLEPCARVRGDRPRAAARGAGARRPGGGPAGAPGGRPPHGGRARRPARRAPRRRGTPSPARTARC